MKKPVLFTVDVEAPTGNNGIEKLIYGRLSDNKEYGIGLLMKIFDNYSIKGLFFVDIAEAWEYGFDNVASVMRYIESEGHDVAVHIHPDRMCDKNRRYLWQYSYNEQYEMIEKCTSFFVKVMGFSPIAFRAGRYGANNDTLAILNRFGYKYDFSEFYGKRNCRITPPITCNKVVNYENVVECPVTSYKSFKFGKYERFDKLDSAMRYAEYKHIIDAIAADNSVDLVTLFAHSFSFLNWRRCPDNPIFIKREYDKVLHMLKLVKDDSRYEFISLDQITSHFNVDIPHHSFAVTDYSSASLSSVFFMDRAFKVIKNRLENNV